jgi:uncharacterized repeat protein (TIGR01451 family)
MSRQLGVGVAVILGFAAFAVLLAWPAWAREQPTPLAEREATTAYTTRNQLLQSDSSILLEEDFEHDGDFPPLGWEVFTNTVDGWEATKDFFSRGWSAHVPGGTGLNEALISSDLAVYGHPTQVTFQGRKSFISDQKLTLWVVLDAWDAGTEDDKMLVANVMPALTPNNWTQVVYPIPDAYTGTIRLAWQYIVTDTAGNFYLDDILVEVQQPKFIPPHSHVIAPYKVEPGAALTYVLALSNTGQLTATAAVVSDVLPAGVSHVAESASWSARGSGVISAAFTDTVGLVAWSGAIPVGAGLLITIPVQVVAAPGELISNVVRVDDPDIVEPFTLAGQTQVYPTGTLAYYASFNADGGGWQGGGDWEWGQPVKPLDAPHSWPAAWGTDLGDGSNGAYDRSVDHILTTTLDLTGHPLTYTYLLQWWEWFEVDDGDAGLVQVDGATVYEVHINRTEWTERLLNLSAYAGQHITLTYTLTSSNFGEANTGGWTIDDVALHVLPPVAEFDGSSKRADRTKVAPGGQLTYTLYLTNSGYAASTQGRLYDPLPTGLQVSQVYSSGPGLVSFGSDYVEWRTTEQYSMPIGTDTTITVVVEVSPALACGTALLNSAVVSEATGYAETLLQAPQVEVYPGEVRYASLFDADNGGLTQQGGVWAWGAAAAYGDGPAWDGQPAHTIPYVWGTRLNGDVPDSSASAYTLTLGVDLSAAGQLPLALQWWDWYEPGDPAHVGKVLLSSVQAPTPVELYRVQGEQGAGWGHHSLDVSDWIGHSGVQVRFVYATDGDGASGPGWYIDSLALHDACPQLHLRPASQTGVACRGLEAAYTLDVFNWDRTPTRVDLSLSDNTWPAGVTPVITVPAAATTTVVISVAVPELGDNIDALTVSAAADNGLAATARITTTATITAHWQSLAPLPQRRAFHAVVALDGALYAIGGSRDAGGTQPVSTTYRYDPAADAWAERTGLPTPLSHVDGVALNGEIFVPGGRMSGGVYTHTTFVYSPTLDSWRVIAAPPAVNPAAGYEALAYDGQLVRLGGYLSPTLVTSEAWALNPATGVWSAFPALPAPRADFAAGLDGAQIIVAGGSNGTVYLTDTQVFTAGAWSAADPLPTSAAFDRWTGSADAEAGGWFYLAGGARSDAALDHTGRYSATVGSWTVTPGLPRLRQPRQDLEAAVIGGVIYAVGGRDAAGGQLYDANERLVFCPVCVGMTGASIAPPEFEPFPGETNPVDGQVVTFTASFEPALASSPMQWVWDWGDGTLQGSGQSAIHVFFGADPDRADPDPYEDFLIVVTGTNCAGPVRGERWISVGSAPVYSMSLRSNNPIQYGTPITPAIHGASVYNLGNRTDSYTVTWSGWQWTTTLVYPLFQPIDPSISRPMLYRVQVPPEANKGDSDTFTVTVTSHSDPGLVRHVMLTTIYPEDEPLPGGFLVYLPIVLK